MKTPRKLFAVAVPRSIVWVEAESIGEAIARLSDDCDGAEFEEDPALDAAIERVGPFGN